MVEKLHVHQKIHFWTNYQKCKNNYLINSLIEINPNFGQISYEKAREW